MPLLLVDFSHGSLNGTPDADTITGRGDFDSISGGAGDDIIHVEGAQHTIHGGAGNDDIVASTVGIAFGDAGDDTITGRTDEVINLIDGGAGDDRLTGDPDGSAFFSYVLYNQASGGVRVDLDSRAAQAVGGGQGTDTLYGFSGVVGSAFNDTLSGTGHLIGGAGNDVFQGGAFGGRFDGGAGDDTYLGSATQVDTVTFGVEPYTGAVMAGMAGGRPTGSLTVDLRISGPQAVGGGMGVDTFINVDNLSGSAFNDTLIGTDLANVLSGEAGDDSLSGQGGDDLLADIDGNDSLAGGDGNDRLQTYHGRHWLRGDAGDDTVQGGDGFDDAHGNVGDDSLTAGAGNDWVRGGQGNDVLAGGDGDDFLAGDRGDDTLSGGLGADVFHTFGAAGLDRVTDFSIGQGDRVQVLAGEAYSVAQVGVDVVVSVGAARIVLVNVSLAALPDGWIFQG